MPGKETRLWRRTIEFRQTRLTRLVTLKNQIRASLRQRSIAAPTRVWTVKGTSWFTTQSESDDARALRRDLLIEELCELKKRIKRVGLQLKSMSSPRPGVALLMRIPGIGPRSAEALAAYIDNANRFSSTRMAGNYFGWDPCKDASADTNRLGHITRDVRDQTLGEDACRVRKGSSPMIFSTLRNSVLNLLSVMGVPNRVD